ncbi:MAG: hypothetical protein JOZ44_04600 [Acidobacteria bacterium]|nr:hypothetical protein [Acidobacteriota bacterium]
MTAQLPFAMPTNQAACGYVVKRSQLADMQQALTSMFSFWLDANALHAS